MTGLDRIDVLHVSTDRLEFQHFRLFIILHIEHYVISKSWDMLKGEAVVYSEPLDIHDSHNPSAILISFGYTLDHIVFSHQQAVAYTHAIPFLRAKYLTSNT